MKVKFDQKNFYIADKGIHNSIFLFDKNGKFIRIIGTQGRGPNEYINFVDFSIDNDSIFILSTIGTESIISCYSEYGQFQFSKVIQISATSFERIKGNYLFNVSYNKILHSHRLYLFNKELEIIDKYLPNKTDIDLPIYEDNFFKINLITLHTFLRMQL